MEISELFYSFQTSLKARGTLDSLPVTTLICELALVLSGWLWPWPVSTKMTRRNIKKIISYILRDFSSYYFKHLMTHIKQVWLKASHMLMENKSLDIDKIWCVTGFRSYCGYLRNQWNPPLQRSFGALSLISVKADFPHCLKRFKPTLLTCGAY